MLLEAPRFVLLAKFLGGIGTCTLLAVEGCVGYSPGDKFLEDVCGMIHETTDNT